MSFYYYAVIPKYKILIRLGTSHYDEDSLEELKNLLSTIDLDELNQLQEWFLCDVSSTKIKDISELSLQDFSKVVKYFEDTSVLISILSEEQWSFAVLILFGDEIEEIIPEDKVDDYVTDGYIVIE